MYNKDQENPMEMVLFYVFIALPASGQKWRWGNCQALMCIIESLLHSAMRSYTLLHNSDQGTRSCRTNVSAGVEL